MVDFYFGRVVWAVTFTDVSAACYADGSAVGADGSYACTRAEVLIAPSAMQATPTAAPETAPETAPDDPRDDPRDNPRPRPRAARFGAELGVMVHGQLVRSAEDLMDLRWELWSAGTGVPAPACCGLL